MDKAIISVWSILHTTVYKNEVNFHYIITLGLEDIIDPLIVRLDLIIERKITENKIFDF